MKFHAFLLCLIFLPSIATCAEPTPIRTAVDDWPWWRGPGRNGIANDDQKPPQAWSDTKNVLWKIAIPGRGHGSATVVGNNVFLATADTDKQEQAVHCFNRETGERRWATVVHKGGFPDPKEKRGAGNTKSTMASGTVACDGDSVFINFLNSGAVYTTALSIGGKQLWQTKITDYLVHQGYGSSPALYEHVVIVSADNKSGGAIVAMNRTTGDVVWKRDRPKLPNYPSPIILNIDGKDQLLLTGCELVTSLNPLTGEEFWESEGATTECVTTTVTDGTHIFTSGGYPKNHIAAMVADGTGKVAWEDKARTYVPSILAKDGYLYVALDAGILMCRKSDTGEIQWRARLAGNFSSSPVLVGNVIYLTNETGTTFVVEVTPDGYKKISTNRLGDSGFATPTICGGRIYTRVAHKADGKRQEYLYCLAQPR